jgi:hypothetical protein
MKRYRLGGTISIPGIVTKNSEVIDMAEQKAKPATKKVATAKAGSAAVSKPKTAIKPAVKKTVAKKPGAAVKKAATPVMKKKAPATKASGAKVKATAKPVTVKKTAAKPTPEERYRMVETTAYFIAERNGFQGDSTEHWAEAEREIAGRLDW